MDDLQAILNTGMDAIFFVLGYYLARRSADRELLKVGGVHGKICELLELMSARVEYLERARAHLREERDGLKRLLETARPWHPFRSPGGDR